MDELEALIREQKRDMYFGHKVWPEHRDMVSLDSMALAGLDVDDHGDVPMFTKSGFRKKNYSGERTGLRRNRPHGTRCKKPEHKGEGRKTPSTGKAYCNGCRREYKQRWEAKRRGTV